MTDIYKDILNNAELKANPYGLPEGYMDSLKEKALKYSKPAHVSARERHRILTYVISAAASFLLIISAGALLSTLRSTDGEMTVEDYMVFSNEFSILDIYETLEEDQYADAAISEDDVIEYLIYTGINENIVELSK